MADGDRVLQEKRDLLAVLLAERERIEAEKAKTYRLYMEDRITSEGFGDLYRPLEERGAQLAEETPRLQAEIDFLSIKNLSSEEVVREARDLYSHWHELPFDERRSIVETIVDRITVGTGEVEIDLAYLPSPSEMVAERCRTAICAVPFCHIKLRARRPDPPGYPASPTILGEHLRRRRMDLGLSRKEVGRTLGVKAHTVALWELDLRRPSTKYLSSIVRFLGYDPVPEVTCLPKRLKAARRRLGLSLRELGSRFGIDPKTICKWETGRGSRRTRRMEQLFEGFVREVEAADPGVV